MKEQFVFDFALFLHMKIRVLILNKDFDFENYDEIIIFRV